MRRLFTRRGGLAAGIHGVLVVVAYEVAAPVEKIDARKVAVGMVTT